SIGELDGAMDARRAAVGGEACPSDHDRLADGDWVGCPGKGERVGAAGANLIVGGIENSELKLADSDHRNLHPLGESAERPIVLIGDEYRGVEQPELRHTHISSRVCPATSSSSALRPGSAARSRSWSRKTAPPSQRVRCPWGTMSAVGSPLTVRTTRSPTLTASIT